MILKFRLLFALASLLSIIFLGVNWRIRTSPPEYLGTSYRAYNSTSGLPATDYAIATFLTGQNTDDAYFVATRVLTHQLMHAETTKCDPEKVTFLVLCSESVSTEQKNILRNDGATVLEVRDVPVNWWIHSGVQRWKEQFTKLRVFEMTEYKRILFIDADILVTSKIDGIFNEPEVANLAPTLNRKKAHKWGESELRSNGSLLLVPTTPSQESAITHFLLFRHYLSAPDSSLLHLIGRYTPICFP